MGYTQPERSDTRKGSLNIFIVLEHLHSDLPEQFWNFVII